MIFSQSAGDRKVRAFSLSSSFLDPFQDKEPKWGPVGYFTYKRTYSRPLPDGGTEEWWQTCKRVVEGTFQIQKIHCRRMGLPWNEAKAQKSAQDMYGRMFVFKFTPPGRGIWMMGTDVIYERGSACLQNCSFTSTENLADDFSGPFTFLMDLSMLGVGVGSDTRGKGKVRVQVPNTTEDAYVVEDSREGWVDLVRVVLDSFVGKGAYPLNIDYRKVRGRGEPLKTSGGVSAGPAPLQSLLGGVSRVLLPEGVSVSFDVPVDATTGKIGLVRVLFQGQGEPYRIGSSQIVDVFNYIGKAVVAGGIRRSSEIMFGDPEDHEFVTLKHDQEALRDRRWASNNSVFATVGMDYTEIVDSIVKNGEPGLLWLDNVHRFGRMNGHEDGRDWRAKGANPCSEMALESGELCNLVESFPAHHESYRDYEATLKMAYLYAKTVTLVPTHLEQANQVMMRNRRIGCSMSGIIQAMQKLGRRRFLGWCDRGYAYIQNLDRIYSEWLGIPLSIRTTTTKPSGTVSLLCGATPGIHYPHSEFYIRHIRVQNTSPLVQAARDAGFPVYTDPYADDTSVVAFPVKEKHFQKGKAEATVWEQFINVADLQRHWADNQISVTLTFSKDEVRDIQPALEAFEDRLKGVSLLPLRDEDHGYQFAPYQEITAEQYHAMVAQVSPINFGGSNTHDRDSEDKFCTGDTCTRVIPTK